jgi:transcriptional regulator with XRE-family HTH domain
MTKLQTGKVKRHSHGEEFKKMRERQNLSQNETAKILGWSNGQFVYMIEKGGACPPLSALPALAVAFKRPLKDLTNLAFKIKADTYRESLKPVALTSKERARVNKILARLKKTQ